MNRIKHTSFKRALLVLLIMVMLNINGGMQGFAAGNLIFHSGFEPGSTGTPVSGSKGAINDITGTDTSFSSNSNWVNDLDGHSNIGNFVLEYENKDNTHQRYADITDDRTNILFEDSFDDSYAIGNAPHYKSNDTGKETGHF